MSVGFFHHKHRKYLLMLGKCNKNCYYFTSNHNLFKGSFLAAFWSSFAALKMTGIAHRCSVVFNDVSIIH